MTIKLKRVTDKEVIRLRKKFKLNQAKFWEPIGVTQSGGSRYETGRRIPHSVGLLLKIAYANRNVMLAVHHKIRHDNA